jgi:hypothetical protein
MIHGQAAYIPAPFGRDSRCRGRVVRTCRVLASALFGRLRRVRCFIAPQGERPIAIEASKRAGLIAAGRHHQDQFVPALRTRRNGYQISRHSCCSLVIKATMCQHGVALGEHTSRDPPGQLSNLDGTIHGQAAWIPALGGGSRAQGTPTGTRPPPSVISGLSSPRLGLFLF